VRQTVGAELPLQYRGPEQLAAVLPTERAYAAHAENAVISV
jgi:hypothetical protein